MNFDEGSEFYIRLCNHQCWRLTASGDTSQFLKKLAHIMRLGTAENGDCHKQFFIQCDRDTSDYHAYIPSNLPKKGWTVRKMMPARLLYHKEVPDVICDIGVTSGRYREYPSMICSLTPIVEQVIRAGGALFHSALIVRGGYGVLLMAPPGVGKSTCCRRLPAPWTAWCDDFSLLIRDEQGDYHAHPLPTMGDLLDGNKNITWDVQAHVPVKAIFLLEQSQWDEATPVGSVQAFSSIYHSALRGCLNIIREEDCDVNADNRYLTFNNVCDITKKIPSYKLRVSINGKFWDEIDRVLHAV